MLPGLLICLAIAIVAWTMNYYKLVTGVSALMWAFVLSIITTNVVKVPAGFKAGINFCSSTVLRFSIAALGLTISAGAWALLGATGLAIVLLVVALGFSLGMVLGKSFGLSKELSTLIGVGTSICGASAIAAAGPAIKAKEAEVGLALSCITIFGLFAMVLYPFLFSSTVVGKWLGDSQASFGVWAGVGIHELSQVVAAGHQVGVEALSVATVAKSVRVFLIGPVVILASYLNSRASGKGEPRKVYIPRYAIIFVLFTILNAVLLSFPTTQPIWAVVSGSYIQPAVVFLLAVSFAGVGYKVKYENIAKVGLKAFGLGLVCALTTSLAGLALVVLFF